MDDLTYYDLKILRHLAGEEIPDLNWGAAMSVSLEFLKSGGYVKTEVWDDVLTYVLTPLGEKIVADNPKGITTCQQQ
jgi:hypothetical protein